MSKFEIMTLKSGAKSLRSVEHQETFHPGTGPLEEARILHVEQQRLQERCRDGGKFIIWDVGFGAAANAIAAVEALHDSPAEVEIHSFDKSIEPLLFAMENAEVLGYLLPHRECVAALLKSGTAVAGPRLRWYLHTGDFAASMLKESLPSPHSVFYDPYSPARNQDMWTLDHFKNLRRRLDDSRPCLWSNYTRSTAVRVTLLLADFYVGVGCLVGEKDQTTVASNVKSLIERPLAADWLERVKVSGNSAPMRNTEYGLRPIGDADYLRLSSHEQFYHE